MINQTEIDRMYDCDVVDEHGERIGSVKQVWLDDHDGRPLWASVHTGLLGLKETFVPIQNARMGKGRITVPVDKEKVKSAPSIDVRDDHMSDAQQEELYRYYNLIPQANTGQHDRMPRGAADRTAATGMATDRMAADRTATDRAAGDRMAANRGAADRGPADRTAADRGVTRHEEQLDVHTREVEAGRVRLVKHTVTEQRSMTVPVTHEEVRVVREPADRATDDAFTDQEAEITLRREEPVVEKRVEPVERVRLEKDTVTEQREVGGEVRQERIDVQRDDDPRRRR
jgi:uncharacterized protein (TIGR02271 family)